MAEATNDRNLLPPNNAHSEQKHTPLPVPKSRPDLDVSRQLAGSGMACMPVPRLMLNVRPALSRSLSSHPLLGSSPSQLGIPFVEDL